MAVNNASYVRGSPPADASGRVIGVVPRTDLLRTLVTDLPLDLLG